jgi:hypothetical protein
MTRARNVSKPPGAKPGLVQLNGDVKTITLRKDEVERWCEQMEKTVLVNQKIHFKVKSMPIDANRLLVFAQRDIHITS